jgi:deoxyribodipyrimidine photolyase
VASNAGNWQWMAGTGHNRRPNRVMSPLRQTQRFDPAGDYVRRHVPELSGLPPAAIHTPWRLDPGARRRLGYPAPLVELTLFLYGTGRGSPPAPSPAHTSGGVRRCPHLRDST